MPASSPTPVPIAVLLGGGIESTVLVLRYLAKGEAVLPIHVHCGLIWDDCEATYVRRFLAGLDHRNLLPLRECRIPLRDFLGDHWAVTGVGAPRADASAAQLEIPLRNLALLGFALHRLPEYSPVRLALGTTAENCYRDGSREYFDRCQEVLSLEAGRPVQILTPLIELTKSQVIQQTGGERLALSFSCVSPVSGNHCGVCIKCGRRRKAFQVAGVTDPTRYAD
ncbi:MAG: 7-cyano-7-deazaguanine synthase [Planctomycetales bacterium]